MRIICVVSAAHDVPQVGLFCGSATPESGLCVGPQHQRVVFVWVRNTIYWSVGMQAVQWCHVHSSTGDLSLNIKIKINGYRFKQNGVYL